MRFTFRLRFLFPNTARLFYRYRLLLSRYGIALKKGSPYLGDPHRIHWFELLQSNLCANFFQLCLDVVCFVLGSAFLYHLRSAFYQFLGLLQAQTCDGTDNLDNVHLLLAEAGQLYVELSLLFLRNE